MKLKDMMDCEVKVLLIVFWNYCKLLSVMSNRVKEAQIRFLNLILHVFIWPFVSHITH